MPQKWSDKRLELFCGDKWGRYDLRVPWRVGGYWYATDCKILVRSPTRAKTPWNAEKKPHGEEMFTSWPTCVEWRDFGVPFRVLVQSPSTKPRAALYGSVCISSEHLLAMAKADVTNWLPNNNDCVFFIGSGGLEGVVMGLTLLDDGVLRWLPEEER